MNNFPIISHERKTYPLRHRIAMDLDAMENNESGRYHVVTNLVIFIYKMLRRSQLTYSKSPTDEHLEARMVECLERNLNNTLAAYVHVLLLQ